MAALSPAQVRSAQAEGYASLLANASPRGNPYPWSDPRCGAWNAGYCQARTDRKRRMTRGVPHGMDGSAPSGR